MVRDLVFGFGKPWRMARVIALLLALGSLLVGVPSPAAAPGHLSKMPSVADVKKTVQGSDAFDTAGRQQVVLRELGRLVRELSKGGEFGHQLTPEETALLNDYTQAANEADKRCYALGGNGTDARQRIQKTCRRTGERVFEQAYPELAALRTGRNKADKEALDEAVRSRQPQGPGMSALVYPAAGLVVTLIGVGLLVAAMKILSRAKAETDAIRREEFHRRTSGGVLQFATFEEAEAHNQKKTGNSLGAMAGIVILLFGLGVAAIGAILLFFSAAVVVHLLRQLF